MQVYVPVVLAAAAGVVEVGVVEVGVVEAPVEAAVAPRGESAAFRRIDKNPTYFYDRITVAVTVTFVIHHHNHLFRILSTVLE
jgi:hypothetical protein